MKFNLVNAKKKLPDAEFEQVSPFRRNLPFDLKAPIDSSQAQILTQEFSEEIEKPIYCDLSFKFFLVVTE